MSYYVVMTPREIAQRYREHHREELRQKARSYYHANKERVLARFAAAAAAGGQSWRERESVRHRAWKARNRENIISLLGGRCAHCGFDDWRALQIDHVLGGGYRELRSISSLNSYYKKIRASHEQGLGEYQVLCANCNQIKRHEADEFSRVYSRSAIRI